MIRIVAIALLALAGTTPAAPPQPTTTAPPAAATAAVAPPAATSPAAAGPATAPTTTAHPALWKVTSATGTVWLFGTIHALPPGYAWRDAAIGRAIADAQALVIETMLDPDPAKSSALFYSLALAPGLPPLVERVRPADRAKLAAMLARSPIPAKTLDAMKTWAAGLIVTGTALADLGLTASAGVESSVERSFAAAHKPVTGLETPAQQFGFLDSLPEDEQRRLLGEMLDDPQEARAEFTAMLKAWGSGDEAAIARTFDEEANVSPLLRAVLITRRNAAWAEWIAARLKQPGATMIAVGAGHLAGPGSVQALLAAKGFTVTRVQ